MSTLLAFLLALAQAVPAIERMLRSVVAQIDAQRERDAAQRLQEKDARVDDAIREAVQESRNEL